MARTTIVRATRNLIVKVRALSDEELAPLDGQSALYIRENYDSTGYKIYTPTEQKAYEYLSKYMRPVNLYYKEIDFEAIKDFSGIPSEFEFKKMTVLPEKKLIEFENSRGGSYTVTITSIMLGHFIKKKYGQYYIAYVEPLQTIGDEDANDIVLTSGLTDEDFEPLPGYFPLHEITMSLDGIVTANLEHGPDEAIMFNTFESIDLKS